MKYTYCVLAMLCLWANIVQAQKTRPLAVGDTVPDITLHHIINAPFSSSKLSDFKDKVVILDFFATWCSNCVKALPHLDSLQRKLPNQLQALVIDPYEDQATVARFLKTNRLLKGIAIPFVTGDTLLSQLLPRKYIPHEVWLYNGVVKAVTYPGDVTAENIQMLTKGGTVSSTKFDILDDDIKKPLQVTERTVIHHRSLLTGYIEGYGTSSYIEEKGRDSIIRICYRNIPLAAIYKKAYEAEAVTANRFIYENGADTLLLQTAEWDNWKRSHTYCYELVVPPCSMAHLRQLMQNDIESSFGITLTKVRNKTHCWVLLKTGKEIPATGVGKPADNLYDNMDSVLYIHHQPIKKLVAYLNSFSAMPVLDETNITQQVYMDFSMLQRNDMTAWQKALQSYGLLLEQQEREIDVYRYSRLPHY